MTQTHKFPPQATTFTDVIVSCEVAAAHLNLLDALSRLEPGLVGVRSAVASTAAEYAKRSWQNAQGKEKGSVFNSQERKILRQ